MREAVKDKSYRSTPVGLEVAHFIRWFRNEFGATSETLRDYEAILAKLALDHADLELHDFEPPEGTTRLREFIDERWGDAAPRTSRPHRRRLPTNRRSPRKRCTGFYPAWRRDPLQYFLTLVPSLDLTSRSSVSHAARRLASPTTTRTTSPTTRRPPRTTVTWTPRTRCTAGTTIITARTPRTSRTG